MYHAIVRRRIRALFDAVNRGDAEPVLRMFAGRFEHSFLGEHALGGSRTTLSKTRQWYQRLNRLLPDIRFELREITVSGGPWNTLIAVAWDGPTRAPTTCEPTTAVSTSCICAGGGRHG